MSDELFRVESLKCAYESSVAVLDIPSLQIGVGGVTVLSGPNGSLKTTLLKLLNGLMNATGGRILYSGKPLDAQTLPELRRKSVLVHQDPYLFDGNVYSNVSYGLRLRKIPAPEARGRVKKALEAVGLTGFEHRRAKRLSGGERQRVAIARALVLDPEVLFLDEPTASVDAETIAHLERLILRLTGEGTTVIISTHHPGFAYRLGNRLVFMEEGRLVSGGENIFKGVSESTDERFTYFRTHGQVFRCPARDGHFITAVLPMDDVILSRQSIETSAQNQFTGTVTGVEAEDNSLRVTLDCGCKIQSFITSYSADTLHVAPGEKFYVTFKASAIRLY
jgi:tungstate transport system ATP-binding protein